jgi:DNA-binding response OmpR family regulator
MESKPKRILIADDEADILEIISYNLTQNGYEVYTASNGDEALERAKLLNPDLINMFAGLKKLGNSTISSSTVGSSHL